MVIQVPGFADLAARLRELEGIPSRISGEVAKGINAEIQKQFTSGTDPYGRAWKPLLPQTVRRKGGDRRILRRTDNMSSETVARPMSGAGVEVTSVSYGGYHQIGTKHMVARPIGPDGAELPDSWQKVIDKTSSDAFKKALR